jgi:hypothetical protein
MPDEALSRTSRLARVVLAASLVGAACAPATLPLADAGSGADVSITTDAGTTADTVTTRPDGAALTIAPRTATLPRGGSLVFRCSIPCTFTVQEAGGGTVTRDGNYTAPATTGTYHLVASANGATDAATITVPPAATGTVGRWENVTPAGADPALFSGTNGFGMGTIVADPRRPTDLYVGGYGSLWRSTDYGLTWTQVMSSPVPPSGALGSVVAVGGTGAMATLWITNPRGVSGSQKVYRSDDAGRTFRLIGTLSGAGGPLDATLYSLTVDPYDPMHLISGFHETNGVAESTDGGETWRYVGQDGWPSGGVSWYPFFVDTGDASTTRRTWVAIPQDHGSVVITRDGGAHWTVPNGIAGLLHPHGNSALLQVGSTLFLAGGGGPGDGVYRSTDLGNSWTRVFDRGVGLVFGDARQVYGMWGWACASCVWYMDEVLAFSASQPGDHWSAIDRGAINGLHWGPNSVATTSDGTHAIYVGSMWTAGLWRYVQPE